MYQGKGKETDSRNRELGFQPSDIDYLILSHAHIDHSGLIPYIYREGFRGRILCTPQTRDLCRIMLADSAHIQESDVKSYNKKMLRNGRADLAEPLYLPEDAELCMRLFRAVRYDTDFQLDKHAFFVGRTHPAAGTQRDLHLRRDAPHPCTDHKD